MKKRRQGKNMLLEKTQKILNIIAKEKISKGFIFGGGSAMSYYLNHRSSEDIDLFKASTFINLQEIQKWGADFLKNGYCVKLLTKDEKQIDFLIDGVKVTFCGTGLLFIEDNQKKYSGNLNIASLDVIVAMKANVLFLRYEPRDYYDLAVVIKEKSMEYLLDSYLKYYPMENAKNLLAKLTNNKSLPELPKHLQYNKFKNIEEVRKYLLQSLQEYLLTMKQKYTPEANIEHRNR